MSIVSLERISKRYRLSRLGARSLREELAGLGRRLRGAPAEHDDELYALREVSLEIQPAEMLGLIGANGSGKSTLLKIMARITYPSSGRIVVRGAVASLIEVGAGFHPELSGRENVELYGSIMGLRLAEVHAHYDRIVEFAGLERFMDTPVKRYSSGMYVRLGFAVAAHTNPEVLLVDEVLAVGDAAFRAKCLQRIEELRRGGTTIVLVSHDLATVEQLCERAVLLEHGEIRSQGQPHQVIADYQASVAASAVEPAGTTTPAGTAQISGPRFFDDTGAEITAVATGEPLTARLIYRLDEPLNDPIVELSFFGPDDRLYCQLSTTLANDPLLMLQSAGCVEFRCPELGLTAGTYTVQAAITQPGLAPARTRADHRVDLVVLAGKPVRGLFYQPHSCRLTES